MQFSGTCTSQPVCLLWYLRSCYLQLLLQAHTVLQEKQCSPYQEQGLAQVDVHNVVADLSVTAQVEALAADLPPAFQEVRRLP